MEHATTGTRGAGELLGVLFTTPKELRHMAEQNLGQLFVPTEVLHAGPRAAIVVLRPQGMSEIVVHAERERHGYPYQITRVDTH
ncbi:MAG TPA: hypothetical protein VHG91_16445 [Longimicrobium sp.]|nr:hypothetical protein [Longimicrobium sp.]